MNNVYKIITAATDEPITLAEAKAQCRVEDEFADDDTYLTTAISTARDVVEKLTGRFLMDQEVEVYLKEFPSTRRIEIPKPPLTAVNSLKYYDEADAIQTLASSSYRVSVNTEPGFLELKADNYWPDTETRFDAVIVNFQAGYASASAVPASIKHAILMMVSDLYTRRDATTEMRPYLQRAAEILMSSSRVFHSL